MAQLNPVQADQEAQTNIGTSTYATNEEPGPLGEDPEEITYHTNNAAVYFDDDTAAKALDHQSSKESRQKGLYQD